MPSCKVKSYKFHKEDVRLPVRTVQAIWKAQMDWEGYRRNPDGGKMSAPTSLHYYEPDGLVYCGMTSWVNQLLFTFDPDTKQFKDLEFQNREFCEPWDMKIHRSFEPDDDGTILFATACLHNFADQPYAPGGRIFRLHPKSGEIEVLGRPVARDYIQTIAFDRKRKIVYGNCFPNGGSFRFDVKTSCTSFPSEHVSSHKARCDNEGNLWGESRTSTKSIPFVSEEELGMMVIWNAPTGSPVFYKYNPDDGYQHLDEGLPLINGQCQGLSNLLDVGDGGMWMGTSVGRLYRADKKTGAVEQVAENVGGRLEGIGHDPERGLLFLAGGSFYQTAVFVVDIEKRKLISDYWPLADPDTGDRCVIVHALCNTKRNGTHLVYIGETDNPNRAGYLWECEIEV